jgi:Sec-independent protein translocase protein TatA
MSFIRLLGELALIYILYKVVFDFIIPAYKGVKEVKTKMNDMAARMQEQQRAHSNQHAQATKPVEKPSKPASDDYIEYEEVK